MNKEHTGMDTSIISSAARIGHVHLRVADLDRAMAFYRDVLGFAVTIYGPAFGMQAVFLAAGDYHHHIALYYDRPREEWFDAAGNFRMQAVPFDPRDLLAESLSSTL